MAKNQGGPPSAPAGRGAKPPAKPAGKAPASAAQAATPDAPKKKTSLPQFAREVRAEARKITWTSRKETWITSVMVFIMVVMTAVFFLVVDSLLSQGMQLLLKLAA
jgi:preprotein translocase subunit SecE